MDHVHWASYWRACVLRQTKVYPVLKYIGSWRPPSTRRQRQKQNGMCNMCYIFLKQKAQEIQMWYSGPWFESYNDHHCRSRIKRCNTHTYMELPRYFNAENSNRKHSLSIDKGAIGRNVSSEPNWKTRCWAGWEKKEGKWTVARLSSSQVCTAFLILMAKTILIVVILRCPGPCRLRF